MSRAASAAPGRRGARAASCRSDMPQNARAARPGCRRKIACLPHHRLMTQESERDGLFGFAVEEDLIEEHDRTGLDLRGQPLHERGILRAPARDDDLGL